MICSALLFYSVQILVIAKFHIDVNIMTKVPSTIRTTILITVAASLPHVTKVTTVGNSKKGVIVTEVTL